MFAQIEQWTMTKTKFEVMDILNELDMPCGPILSMKEIAEEPSLRETGTVVEVDHPKRGKYLTVGNPIKLSDSPTEVTRSPLLGEHTDEVLARAGVRQGRDRGVARGKSDLTRSAGGERGRRPGTTERTRFMPNVLTGDGAPRATPAMTQLDALLESPTLVLVVVVLIVAALAHGTMGFGFPLISTPMIAMMTDIQTAVLVTLFPNLAVNLISIFGGGNWRSSLAKYWHVAAYVAIGTVAGTRLLIIADPEPLKLLLAAMIVVYLQQAAIPRARLVLARAASRRRRRCRSDWSADSSRGRSTSPCRRSSSISWRCGLDALAMTQITQSLLLSSAGRRRRSRLERPARSASRRWSRPLPLTLHVGRGPLRRHAHPEPHPAGDLSGEYCERYCG